MSELLNIKIHSYSIIHSNTQTQRDSLPENEVLKDHPQKKNVMQIWNDMRMKKMMTVKVSL